MGDTPAGPDPIADQADDARLRRDELAHRWRVAIGELFETETSLIAFGLRDAKPVVLKVVKQPGDEWRSGEVASMFGGGGMTRVLEYDQGAALFERIVPGMALVELVRQGNDVGATEILADVVASMAPNAAPSWCPTVRDWARGFTWYLGSGDTQIPAPLVRRAAEIYAELCATQRATRLLHGDLQHYNVLRDQHRGWLAIDPKGVVGEVEFELGAMLRNPVELPDSVSNQASLEQRIAILCSRLGLDPGRVLRWAFAQAVLSAIWGVQDGYVVDSRSAPLQLARTIDLMLDSSQVF